MPLPAFVLALLWLPLAAAAEKPRALFGVVPEDAPADAQGGVVVRAVLPGSPAESAHLKPGDRIHAMNGSAVNSRAEMRAVMQQLSPGMPLEFSFSSAGRQGLGHASVVLGERRGRAQASIPRSPDDAVGGDRRLRPLVVDPDIRRAMREKRRLVVKQLAALPASFVPAEVSDHLQAIRDLARDANPQGRGWMQGRAGEVTLQFRDKAGVLVLHGASNKLTLTVYNAAGQQTHSLPLNTPEERAAVPADIIQRLRGLR